MLPHKFFTIENQQILLATVLVQCPYFQGIRQQDLLDVVEHYHHTQNVRSVRISEILL